MFSTERTRPPTSHSKTHSTFTLQLPCLGHHRLQLTRYEQRDKEEERAAMSAMSADFYSEELELEDLKAFERRMEELAAANRPRPVRWPLVLGTIFACTAISACHWFEDVRESESFVLRMLSSRGALAISLATIVVMILYGVKHVNKPYPRDSVQNTRDALALFQLHCDNDGRLIHVAPMSRESTHRTSPSSRSWHSTH